MAKLMRLRDLMPTYYDDVVEMNTIIAVEQSTLDELEVAIEEQAANQFVMTADENGIAVWEEVAGLISIRSLSLETRRYNVLAAILPHSRITIRYLREVLKNLNINAELKVDGLMFHVDVTINATDPGATKRLNGLLASLLPANLTFTAINSGESAEDATLYTGASTMNSRSIINSSKED